MNIQCGGVISLFKACSQNAGLDCLSEYLDTNRKTGGSVINFFTPHNPSIAHPKMMFLDLSVSQFQRPIITINCRLPQTL